MEPDDGTFYVCETCREKLDPADPNVIRAIEQIPIESFGGRHSIDGLGAYFHRACFPGGSRYRLDDQPGLDL